MTREEALKVAKPILFNGEMVRAILDGRKTVTRRLVKPQPKPKHIYRLGICRDGGKREAGMYGFGSRVCGGDVMYVKPPCLIGDILYVRETWTKLYYVDPDGCTHYDQEMYFYAADGMPDITLIDADGFDEDDQRIRWHPSIHMPREAARIFLRVTDVRVERLQDIMVEQAEKEGCGSYLTESKFNVSPVCHFMELWDSTIKKSDLDRYGWVANPWVWVIEFERLEVG